MKNTRKVLKIPVIGLALIAAITIALSLAGCASMILVSLEEDTVDGPKQVRQGLDINPRDITVWGLYKDDSRKLVTIRSGDITFNKHATGPQTVRIRVSGQEASFQTEVMPLRTLTIASQPRTTIFKQGQEADRAWPGLEIRGEWASMGSDRIDIASCEVSGFNKDTLGRQTVRVSFEGQSATFNVEVRGLTSIRIAQPPAKVNYSTGESLNLTGLRVMGVWEGLPEEEIAITRNDVTGFDASRVGTQRLTVTKNGRTATFTVEVVQTLNGTWAAAAAGYTFNNGNWENFYTAINNGNPVMQGTYTTNGSKITMTTTRVHGTVLGTGTNYEAKWWTRSEFEPAYRALNPNASDEVIRMFVDGFFSTFTYDYTLSGNTLTLTMTREGSPTVTYTKR